jgi:hypothetical protein
VSCQAVASHSMGRDGSRVGQVSFCRCASSPACSVGCSSRLSRKHLMQGNFASTDRSQR